MDKDKLLASERQLKSDALTINQELSELDHCVDNYSRLSKDSEHYLVAIMSSLYGSDEKMQFEDLIQSQIDLERQIHSSFSQEKEDLLHTKKQISNQIEEVELQLKRVSKEA